MALDEVALASSPQAKPRSRGPLRLLTLPFRFSFRILKRSLAGILRTVAYHPVSSLIILLLAATVGFLVRQDYGITSRAGGRSFSDVNPALPRSAAAEDFVKGQITFNADLIWQGFSDNFKQQLARRGTNEQVLQRQLDQRKQSGAKVNQVLYAGGLETNEGNKLFIYVLRVESPGSGGVLTENPYVLTVDSSDKIINVE